MVCAAVCGFEQQTGTPYSEREKDVFAIDSLMLANPRTRHGGKGADIMHAASQGAGSGVPRGAGRLRTDTPRELGPMLTIPKPYTFLTADEVTAFIADRDAQVRGAPERERFRGVSDYFTLADVYFNQNGRFALTALSSWCGGLCGQISVESVREAG